MKNQFKKLIGSLLCLQVTFYFSIGCNSYNEEENSKLMGSGPGIMLSTIAVNDLGEAREYFADTLGFFIPDENSNGEYEGTHSVWIYFPDFGGLELLSINDTLEETSPPNFIQSYLEKHEGGRMYALFTSSAEDTYDLLTSRGFETDSINTLRTSDEEPSSWSWDDGGPDIRTLDFDSGNPPAHLPRFIEEIGSWAYNADSDWNTFYSFNRQYYNHPNGVVGLSNLSIVVDDIVKTADTYSKMGLTRVHDDNPSIARFMVYRNQEVRLLSAETVAMKEHLSKKGQGIFSMQFEVKDIRASFDSLSQKLPEGAVSWSDDSSKLILAQQYAYGVKMEFIQEPLEQATLAARYQLGETLDSAARDNASQLYQKYCALCHAENREGYAADNAPSLKSQSLLATSKNTNFLRYTVQYGRAGTAMGGYYKEQGGPLEYIEIELILQWLYESSGVEEPIKLSREPVTGDIEQGRQLYDAKCAICHGADGEGVTAPALGNPMLLATATDHFLRYAIAEGRDGTPMIPFKDQLDSLEINSLTAFLRTRASGWDIPKLDSIKIPTPDNYVINPKGDQPQFNLRDSMYVSAKQVYEAFQDSTRMMILDARSEVAWRQMHIPGSLPVPYYEEAENFAKYVPDKDTWVVVYCACPHAASSRVVNTLRRLGIDKAVILDEGILVWAQMGYPVIHGN